MYARRRMRNEARIGLGQFTVCSSLATHWRKHHVQQSVNRSVNAGQTAATLKVNDLRGSLQTFQQFSVVITPRQDHCSRLQSALFAAPAVLKTDRQTDRHATSGEHRVLLSSWSTTGSVLLVAAESRHCVTMPTRL